MSERHWVSESGRDFACFPAGVLVVIVDDAGRVLLLGGPHDWQVVNGAMEEGETVLDAVLRETAEEAGAAVRIRPLGAAHVYSFPYDKSVARMISVCFVAAYEGGDVVAGDDMAGTQARWATLEEIESGAVHVVIPEHTWILRRAVELANLWCDAAVDLQPWS